MKIIPKNTRPKKTLYKCYTFVDFILMFVFFGIAGLFAMSNIKIAARVIICVLIVLLGAVLFVPINGELIYKGLFRSIKFVFEKKTFSISDGTIDNLIPQLAISDNLIHYPKYFGAVIELQCINFELQDAWGQEHTLDLLETALKYVDSKLGCDIVKINRPIILDSFRDKLFEKLKDKLKRRKTIKANILASRMEDIAEFNTERVVNRNAYYLVLYSEDKEVLDSMIQNVSEYLTQAKLFKQRLNNRDLAVFLKYCNLNDFDERQINEEELENVIKPSSITFKKDYYKINDKYASMLAIRDYPLEVANGWADGLFNINDTKVVCKIKPVEQDKAVKRVDKVIRELVTDNSAGIKASETIEQDVHLTTMGNVLTALQTSNEQLFDISCTVTCYADTYDELKDIKKSVTKKITNQGLHVSKLFFSQMDGYINGNISALNKLKRFERGINSKSFVAFFPFNSPLTIEENGIFLGLNEYPVCIDIWKRGQNYQNSNAFIVGASGSGKSYFTKTLLTNLYSDDCNVYILDPENEYETLCANLRGDYIDVGNASKGRLNPFHIYNTLSDTGAISDGSETFNSHLRTLESFFKIVFEGASSETLETINNAVAIVYRKKGLTNVDRYDKVLASDFPIFDDLYVELIEQEANTNNDMLKLQLQKAMMYVQKFIGNGRYSKIWNGYSTIKSKSDFTVFNFKTLFSNKNNLVANAQMLLVLRFLEQEIINKRADKKVKHTVVVADEAHLFIDPKFPVALDFFYQMTKRIRKYKGAFIPITQSISDWTSTPEVAHKTTAILKESQYSFIMKLKPVAAQDLAKLYAGANLTDIELRRVIDAGTGRAFFIGNEQQHETFNVVANEYVEALFTNRKVPKNYYKEYFDFINEQLALDPNWGTSLAKGTQESLSLPTKQEVVKLLNAPNEDVA